MSVSTWMVARKRLTDLDQKLVIAFNSLFDIEIEPPDDLIDELKLSLGEHATDEALSSEHFRLNGDVLEVSLYGLWEGDAGYDDGMVLDLDKLPKGTFAIRVYME